MTALSRPTGLGYISSGRMRADISRDEALAEMGIARRCIKANMPNEAGLHVRRARRAWKNYLWYKARIVQ